MRLVAFDYFRGIAILFIVAGHAIGPWAIDSFIERVIANLITGGTALFVFISGFFFHYLSCENFAFKTFLRKKAKLVFLPYLILSLTGFFYFILLSEKTLPWANKLGIGQLESWIELTKTMVIYLWTGRITSAYWFIPFILLIFVLSPLFIRYTQLQGRYRNVILLTLLAATVLIHRPTGNLSPVHAVIYFTPIYMLGIISSIHRQTLTKFIENKTIILGGFVLLLASLQAFIHEDYGSYHKDKIISYAGLDIIIIQKIMMCFFLLSILEKYKHHNIRVLKLLASSSFAIFLIHPWVLHLFTSIETPAFLLALPGAFVFLITASIALAGSLLIAFSMKLILKKNSRYITGW